MATTLATLSARVAQILADSTNQVWVTADLTEAIRRALHAYSAANPLKKITTLTLTTATREISTSAITDAIAIDEAWIPYTAATPEYPPYKRPFRYWKDSAILYIMGQYKPAKGDVARIFYSALQTIKDLDSATATTVPAAHETVICEGAAAHAAASRALDLAEQVTVDRDAVARLTTWASNQLTIFHHNLLTIAITAQGPGHVPLPSLDRFEDQWA
jgi:hypothetical protein